MTRSKGRPPTQRQLRVAEEIRHILAKVFTYQHSGDDLLDRSSITVSEVRISPDLQNATVFVLPLGGKNVPEILAALKEKSWFFRKEVARELPTRIVPRLSFQADHSFDEAHRIDTLLRSPKVKKDLEEKE